MPHLQGGRHKIEIVQNAIQILQGELQIVIGQDFLLGFYRICSIRQKIEVSELQCERYFTLVF